MEFYLLYFLLNTWCVISPIIVKKINLKRTNHEKKRFERMLSGRDLICLMMKKVVFPKITNRARLNDIWSYYIQTKSVIKYYEYLCLTSFGNPWVEMDSFSVLSPINLRNFHSASFDDSCKKLNHQCLY